MLMCPVDRLASFSSGSAMMAEQSAIWAVNIEKCTENDQWPPVIYSPVHVNKEFWQQFQNYAPPSLRVIRTKFARIARTIYIYIHNSQLNRPESVSLASLARQ